MAITMSLSEWCEAVAAHRIQAATAVYRVNKGRNGHNFSPVSDHWEDLPTPQEDAPLGPYCHKMLGLLVEEPSGRFRCGCLREQLQYWWPKCVLRHLWAMGSRFCITVEIGPEMAVFRHQVVFETGTGDMYILTVDRDDLENEVVERFFWH